MLRFLISTVVLLACLPVVGFNPHILDAQQPVLSQRQVYYCQRCGQYHYVQQHQQRQYTPQRSTSIIRNSPLGPIHLQGTVSVTSTG